MLMHNNNIGAVTQLNISERNRTNADESNPMLVDRECATIFDILIFQAAERVRPRSFD